MINTGIGTLILGGQAVSIITHYSSKMIVDALSLSVDLIKNTSVKLMALDQPYLVDIKNELEELDFFENLNNNITFIEWPEMLINLPLNKKHYLIKLDIISETKRKINISFNQ